MSELKIKDLTKVYIKLREEETRLEKDLKAVQDNMKTIKVAMQEQFNDLGIDSVKTESGTVYRTIKTTYFTSDWESFHRMVVENAVPELLEKRIHQGNLAQFRRENPDIDIPGLNSTSSYTVTVKASKEK